MNEDNVQNYGGKSASEMNLKELKELCSTYDIYITGLKKKEDILEVVSAWEDANLKQEEDILSGRAEVIVNNAAQALATHTTVEPGTMHEGKEVVSRFPKEVNGIMYDELTLADQTTHLVKIQ